MKYLSVIMGFCHPQPNRMFPTGFSHFGMKFLGMVLCMMLVMSIAGGHGAEPGSPTSGEMTKERALKIAEEFGIDVGEVDEEIQKILGLTEAQGVVVFAVIGATAAERAGIKVKAIIKEVDGKEVLTLLDLGRALEKALATHNFSVATYEPAGIDDQGIGGGLNFHFVRIVKD